MLVRLIDFILRIPRVPDAPIAGPEIRKMPSWDTPLDQTTAIWGVEGETLKKKP
jgi:hypothetical protein